MTTPVYVDDEPRGVLGLLSRLAGRWFEDTSEGLRQVPTTLSVWVSAGIIVSVVSDPRPGFMATSLTLVTVAQVVASVLPWARLPRQVRYVVPLLQILGVGLLDVCTGLNHSSTNVLLVLPLVALALQPGLLPLVSGLLTCWIIMVTPVVFGIERIHPFADAFVTLAVLTAIGGRAHGTVALVRSQAARLEVAQAELASRAGLLQASRDTLRSIMRAATEQAIMGTDQHGVVESVSTGAQRMFRRSEAGLLGVDVATLLTDVARPPDPVAGTPVPAPLSELVGVAVEGGAHVAEIEVADPEGGTRHLEYVVTPRPTLQGAGPAGYLFVVTDVSARWEEERRQDEFISLVSHEFRTPLASILGYVELFRLEEETLSEDQREYLDVLQRNAERLRLLVDDLLTSAQLVFGVPLTPVRSDLVQVVRASVKGQAPAADASGVRVEVAGDPVVWLVTDSQRVGQVVDNVLSNAVKYSPRGGKVVVTVRAARTPTGGAAARISVADEGPGIPPDEITRITERFYRSRDTRRRRVAGIGLGLSLVQAVTDEHGGHLEIDSEPGRGTTVEIFLPDLGVTE